MTSGVEIVAIGASLGGLHAFTIILSALPRGFALPVVLVQHRSPEADQQLLGLLQRRCALPVVEPGDRTKLTGGRVYVAPANYHLLLDRNSFWLSIDPPVWHARPAIDVTFESIADAYGASALCVMLTCGNEDGAAGARAIKRAGGRVYVQDPATAESPIGPRALLASTRVDGVLDLPGLAALLGSLHPAPAPAP